MFVRRALRAAVGAGRFLCRIPGRRRARNLVTLWQRSTAGLSYHLRAPTFACATVPTAVAHLYSSCPFPRARRARAFSRSSRRSQLMCSSPHCASALRRRGSWQPMNVLLTAAQIPSPRCLPHSSATLRRGGKNVLSLEGNNLRHATLLSKNDASASSSVSMRRIPLHTVRTSTIAQQLQIRHASHGRPMPYWLALLHALCKSGEII